ncbi:MAG: hypothetical protein Q9186_004508 [Xanthomendoza sp. 1 TL-2023]
MVLSSEENIRPIYTILAGSSSHLLDALPLDVVGRMQEQFKKMLQHDKMQIEGNSGNLFCLAVLALISLEQASLPAQEQESSPPPPVERSTDTKEPARGFHLARQFFEAKRAPKTVDLVVLKAIYCCSKTCKLSKQDIIESLQLSNVILRAIDHADRAIWLAKNEAKFGKLIEKISAHDHPSEVHSLALQLFATLSGDRALPDAFLPVCRLALHIPTVSKLPRTLRIGLLVSFHVCSLAWLGRPADVALGLLLDESSVQKHLLSLLQASDPGSPNGVAFRETEAALVLVESFTDCIVKSPSLRQKVLYLLSTNTVADPLHRFLNLETEDLWNKAHDNHKDVCSSAYTRKQILLWQKICSMFLKVAIFSQHDSLSLDPSMASALLDKTFSLESTRFVADVRDWKSELAQNAEHQYNSIVRTMGDACRDLEIRCHEVEGPLREAQAKSARLRNDLDSSRARVAELTSRNHEQSLILEGIDEEKSELTAHVRDLKSEREELLVVRNSLQDRLDAAIQHAGDTERNRISETRDLELSHAAASAEKDEILEEQKHTELVLKVQIQDLEADAVELRAKASIKEEEVVRLEAVVKEQQILLSNASELASETQNTCSRQQEELNLLETDKHALEKEVKELSDSCRSLGAGLEDKITTVDSLSRELDNVRSNHQAELAVQGDKLAQLRQSSNEEIQGLRLSLDKQVEDATSAAQESHSMIKKMESELAMSRAEVEERENALEGIQALHRQTMAFWSKPRRRNAAAEEATQEGSPTLRTPTTSGKPQHKRRSVRFPRESPQHKRSRTATELGSSNQGSNNRLRPSISAGEPATCNKATPMRRPLAGLDAGIQSKRRMSPTRRGSQHKILNQAWHEQHAGGNDENVNTGIGEASLCDSDFFASADQQLIADIHDDAPSMEFSDETTEF